jgi:acetyl esterase/lipase
MHDAPAPQLRIVEGLEYVKRGQEALTGDLYMPIDAHNAPCLVAVHGGAWQRGQRSNYKHLGAYLAKHGIGLFAISYRFAPKNLFPAAVQDARAGVQFLRSKGAGLGIDPQRLAIIGDSAGGQLAALVALAGDNAEFAGKPDDAYPGVSTRVKVCVPVYGVYDMMAQWEADQSLAPSKSGSEVFLGTTPLEDPFLFHRASPINYVTKANNQTTFFMSWGANDDIVDPAAQSGRLLTALKRAEIYVRTCVVEAPHFWLSEPLDEPGSFSGFLAPRLLRFLKERL